MSWVYVKTRETLEGGYAKYLYTVGFYKPDGSWNPESNWDSADEARQQVNYLNGGKEKVGNNARNDN